MKADTGCLLQEFWAKLTDRSTITWDTYFINRWRLYWKYCWI